MHPLLSDRYAEQNSSRGADVPSDGSQHKSASAATSSSPSSSSAPVPTASQLTSYIKGAWTVEALFRTYSRQAKHMNHIHISAFWNVLGRLSREAERGWAEGHASARQALEAHTTHQALPGNPGKRPGCNK